MPRQHNVDYYAQRASAAIIFTEATVISPQGMGWPDAGAIYTPEQTEGWKKVTEAVHQKGGIIYLQAWHMGRVTHSSFHGLQPVSASEIAANGDGPLGADYKKHAYEVPKALDSEGIASAVAEFKQAAENAKIAGFDGFEIHSANGYFLGTPTIRI